jgi:hypothetical protein
MILGQPQQPAGRVRVALVEGAQQLGDVVAHLRQIIPTQRSVRQRVAGLKLRRTRSWAMRSCKCPMSHLLVSEKDYTRKSSTRSSDDEPKRDRGRHHCETARHRPRSAASPSFNGRMPTPGPWFSGWAVTHWYLAESRGRTIRRSVSVSLRSTLQTLA